MYYKLLLCHTAEVVTVKLKLTSLFRSKIKIATCQRKNFQKKEKKIILFKRLSYVTSRKKVQENFDLFISTW